MSIPVHNRVVQVCLLAGALLVLLPSFAIGQALQALGLVLGAYFVLLCARNLMPAAILLVILSADALGALATWSPEGLLPYMQLLPGVRVTIRDALIAGLLPIALLRLRQRHEVPIFTRPLVAIAVVVTVGFAVGAASDGDFHTPLNIMRTFLSYAMYPILVAAADTQRKFNWILGSLFAVATAAAAFEFYEAVVGSPLPFLARRQANLLYLGGKFVPYLWNRAPVHMFLTLLLAFGCWLEGRATIFHAGLATIGLLGFIVGLTRSWYIFTLVGLLVVFACARDPGRCIRFLATALIVCAAIVTIAWGTTRLTAGTFGGSFLNVWMERSTTLFSPQADASFQTRTVELQAQWQGAWQSPLFGYGLGHDAYHLVVEIGQGDTGMINSILMFGFTGTLIFIGAIAYGFHRSIVVRGRLARSRELGYTLGLTGMWVGLLVGYASDYDFMTGAQFVFLPVLGFVIGDRAERLGESRPECLSVAAATARPVEAAAPLGTARLPANRVGSSRV